MQCMKCGRTLADQGVFCPDCLAVMERYPVKSNTKVLLPKREERRSGRPARRQRTPEEIVELQRKKLSRQRKIILLLSVLLALSAGFVVWQFRQERNMAPLGSNYSTVTDPTSTTPPSTT